MTALGDLVQQREVTREQVEAIMRGDVQLIVLVNLAKTIPGGVFGEFDVEPYEMPHTYIVQAEAEETADALREEHDNPLILLFKLVPLATSGRPSGGS